MDPDSYQCYSNCPTDYFAISISPNFKLCRKSDIYVDTLSDSPIELGTFEYPYKRLSYAFNEILNFVKNYSKDLVTHKELRVLVKADTEHIFYTSHEVMTVLGVWDLTVEPYDPITGLPSLQSTIIIVNNT